MTYNEKVKELLSEFSLEKAIDLTETMIDISIEYGNLEDVNFYTEVKNKLMAAEFNPNHKWCRYRFYTHSEDNRPIIFNPAYPWWVSGYGEDSKGEYSVCIAYLPEGDNLYRYWDDASNVEFTVENKIEFSGRFPKPEYFKES